MRNLAVLSRDFVKNITHFWLHDEHLTPLILGACAFFLVLGGGILIPTNIAWLADSDPATYYLGWGFFRETPWMWPPGANPNYGLGVASSIFYSDSIPLLAIVFKLFSQWLPNAFQYWGMWLLGCFMLQAYFGWQLIGLFTRERWVKWLATGLFVFSPPFLFRLNFHYALCAQWIVLAALYLCFGSKRLPRVFLWPTLAFLTAGIHSYLLAMVTVLWISDGIRRLIMGEIGFLLLAGEVVLYGLSCAFMLWLCGFFMIQHGLEAWGMGEAGMNLLSLLNPRTGRYGSWSHILHGLPTARCDYEGFNFMGLGLIFLLSFYLCRYRSSSVDWRVPKEWIPLVVVLFLLTIFSLSNYVALGHFKLLTYPLPSVCSLLRSTGRMFWPVFYVGLFLLIRFLLKDHHLRTVIWILGIALVVQVFDTSKGWLAVRNERNSVYGSTWPTPLKSGFWTEASSRYQRIYFAPQNVSADKTYKFFSMYALQHRMGTDAVYLARFDLIKYAARNKRLDEELTSGNYDSHALYILDKDHATMAAKSLKSNRDLLENIDGFMVLAPDWKKDL